MTHIREPAPAEHNNLLQQIATLQQQLADCEQDRTAARETEHRFHLFANSVKD